MFCSKCGTQLPDGAMFCTSCGNQLNSQPTAPMMPVEPMAPVMETPVMDAPVMDAPVMMETPVMDAPMMDTPIMPVAEPVMDAPAFNPAGQYPYNNVPNNMPYDMQNNMANNMPVNNGPKKSKAPLFIGIGIAVLVAIIVGIVLALVFSKDDDKKNNKSNKKPTSIVEETTEEETTEEEITEEETIVNADVSEEDAEECVTNFLKALTSSNYSKASKYVWPVILDIYAEEGASKDEACELIAEDFQDEDGNILDYRISSSWIEDSSYFEYTISDLDYEGYDVYDYSSYKEPTGYAVIAMYFTYKGEDAWVSFDLAYIDDKFYIFDYDTDEIDELKSELGSTDASEFDFETSLEENYEFFSQSVDGTTTQFDGYTLTIPSDWTASANGYSAPDQKNFILVSANPLGQSKDETLKALCETYIELGYENLEFGNLAANDKIGYYISSEYIGCEVFIMVFFNEAEDTMYTAIATSEEPDSEYFDIAKAIGASIEIQ